MTKNGFIGRRLRRLWNWLHGKRIIVSEPPRGRVMIRTGSNSASRSNGCQWYLQRYEAANGIPPLPVCSRGRLHRPLTTFQVERFTGEELSLLRRWYEGRHGLLEKGQELVLVCVFDPNEATARSRVMSYGPTQVFEAEYEWLRSGYQGPPFATYFGTWYGTGAIGDDHHMDFEMFCHVHPGWKPFSRWGTSWR
jgi:hypothetical protein